MGGLGVKDLNSFNLALLGKWRWKLLWDRDALWNRVLEAKYNVHKKRDYEGKEVKASSSEWWKAIWRLDKEIESKEGWLLRELEKDIGEGNDTLFWHDKWCGDVSFREKFNRLFRLSENKEMLVKDMGEWREGQWVWKWRWRRNLSQREQSVLQELNEMLKKKNLKQGQQDKWRWKDNPNGNYTTKSAYNILKSSTGEPRSKQMKLLWKIKVPLKVSAFAWKTLQNKIPTGDNLIKRGISGTNSDFPCIFCGNSLETVNHLFFTCETSWRIWQSCYEWWGFQAVSTNEGWGHLQQHVGMIVNGNTKKAWCVIWYTILWSIWLWRNQLIFKEKSDSFDQIIKLIKLRSCDWIRAKYGLDVSKDVWMQNPMEACRIKGVD
ncbi:hypothetical protein SLA2020_382120 [Shorea laevis]